MSLRSGCRQRTNGDVTAHSVGDDIDTNDDAQTTLLFHQLNQELGPAGSGVCIFTALGQGTMTPEATPQPPCLNFTSPAAASPRLALWPENPRQLPCAHAQLSSDSTMPRPSQFSKTRFLIPKVGR
jgi:hypothetical protein